MKLSHSFSVKMLGRNLNVKKVAWKSGKGNQLLLNDQCKLNNNQHVLFCQHSWKLCSCFSVVCTSVCCNIIET